MNTKNYKDIESFQRDIRTHGKLPDYITVAGTLYIMTHYDMDGALVEYENGTTTHRISVTTKDRYIRMIDAVVQLYEI